MKPPSLSDQSVVQWVIHGAANAPLPQEVLTELYERLTAAGLPLWRVTVLLRRLHPEIVERRFVLTPPKHRTRLATDQTEQHHAKNRVT